MLKRFFISMLGTMAGLWISLFLIGFALIGGLIYMGISMSSEVKTEIKGHSLLYFNLDGTVADRQQPISFMQLMQQEQSKAPTLDDMIRSLKSAAADDKIDGLFLDCKGSSMGSASRQELIEAINEFKESGKFVYAYSDRYAQGDYLVATTADYLVLNPIGSIDIHGVGGMVPFFTGLLDKLGVKMQIIKVGTYKSAVEPYILKSMSEPARQQMQQYCDTIWNYVSQTIACNRNIPEDTIRTMASKLIFSNKPEFFLRTNLADTLLYARQSEDMLRDLCGIEHDNDLNLISPADYLASSDILETIVPKDRHIAVLYALGEISDSGNEGIVGSKLAKEIIDLANDDNVCALVMRVNSPGGSAFASEQIWAALEYFKEQAKPFYVSMGEVAASGGYYISCGADRIYADRTTITGSIGVFGMIPDLSGLVTGKLGVTFSTVATNPNINIDVFEPMTPFQYAVMQKSVENIYDLFTSRVAAGRDMTQDDVKKIAEGRVWIGSDALKLGLVDELGSLDMCISDMAHKMGMKSSEVVEYPLLEEKMWEKIIKQSGDFSDLSTDSKALEELREKIFIDRIFKSSPVQARMEDVIIK